MRLRSILLVLATIVVVLFALLNWPEFNRLSTLNLGWRTVEAPLGLVMLGLLALGLVAVVISSAATHTRHLRDARQHHKDLQAQRDLAERAEASRFVELRARLDEHLRESRQREASTGGALEQTLGKGQRELRTQIELMMRSLSTRLDEMESRLEARLPYDPPGKAYVRRADALRAGEVHENARTEATHEVARHAYDDGEPVVPARAAPEQEVHAHADEAAHEPPPLRADPRDRTR
ncbi:MAG TPA: lipopolysaccharide assembly protein LapA domain-containing protein [Ramlibacter sp.]|nr:lipopolysaccharide assembly protein LapA domain-containing protein [Ramlibacter sp.]